MARGGQGGAFVQFFVLLLGFKLLQADIVPGVLFIDEAGGAG